MQTHKLRFNCVTEWIISQGFLEVAWHRYFLIDLNCILRKFMTQRFLLFRYFLSHCAINYTANLTTKDLNSALNDKHPKLDSTAVIWMNLNIIRLMDRQASTLTQTLWTFVKNGTANTIINWCDDDRKQKLIYDVSFAMEIVGKAMEINSTITVTTEHNNSSKRKTREKKTNAQQTDSCLLSLIGGLRNVN